MARYILRQGANNGWFDAADEKLSSLRNAKTAVAIRRSHGDYTFEPSNVSLGLSSAIGRLNVTVAFTMCSEITTATLRNLHPTQTHLNIPIAGARIPVVSSLSEIYPELGDTLSTTACVVRRENLVLVWSDAIESILHVGAEVEAQLLSMVNSRCQYEPRLFC